MQPTPVLPDILLERYLLGELPDRRRDEVRRRLERDPVLRRRLDELSASDHALRGNLPPLAPPARAGRPAARPAAPHPGSAPLRRRAFLWAGAPALASPFKQYLGVVSHALLACSLLFAVLADRGPRSPAPADASQGNAEETVTPAEDGIRLKGLEAGLAIYRKSRSGKPELLPPRSAARAGDTLQIFYQAYRELHGVIFSVDGGGALTLHLPEAAGPAARLERGGLRPLPHAYLLDKAPRLERFYLVTSPSPFSVDSLLALARPALAAGPPDSLVGLPADFRQHAYTLLKPDRKARQGGAP